MAGLLNSGLNGSTSSLPDASGRVLATSFSAQSGSSSAVLNNSVNIQGLQGIHGSFNMPGSFASRNSTMIGGPPNGIQQVSGNVSNGQFAINSLPTALSQLSLANSHGHSGLPNNGGVSPNLGSVGNITNSMSNLGSSRNIARGLGPAGGSNLPGVASHLNLTAPQMVSMLGNSYTAAAVALAQNQFQARNGHIPSMALLTEMNARENAAFDMGEFPQLNGRPNSAGGSQGQLGFMRKQNVGFTQQNQEFSIQNEDFPALPGYRGGTSEFPGSMHSKEPLRDNMMKSQQLSVGRSAGSSFGSTHASHNQHQHHSSSTDVRELSFQPTSYQDLLFHGPKGRSTGISGPGSGPSNLSSAISGVGLYDQTTQQYHQLQKHPQFHMVSPFREEDTSSETSKTVADRFGLLGLLSIIRMTNPALTSLALGVDLTTLGLNLNSSDNLHKKFASPWSEEPAKGEPEYSTPTCYHTQQPPPLKQSHFSRFRLEILFYIFYSMPKDEAQLYAANELHVRGWFYHRELHVWLTRVPNLEPLVKTDTYERGCYFGFDRNTWQTTRKDNFVLQYEMIEKRPVLPQQTAAA